MSLAKKIQENIFRYELLNRGGKIVVGVSGGPDSVCLLDVLCELKNKYNLELVIAHVNYGLRGKDSEKDEQFVKKMAKKYDLPIEIKKISAKIHQISATKSEDAMRNTRYDFFEEVRKKYQAHCIAVGHNLNDQAETVLMRILRGAGLRGISAIKFRNENIIRPLLNIERKEILAYLEKQEITYRIDKSNQGVYFTRNKIRNKLLPFLEKKYNPKVQEILFRLSRSVADDYDFISRYAKEWLNKNKNLSASKISRLHPAIQREVIRQALEKQKPYLFEIESAHVDEILKLVKSSKNKRQKITLKGLKIERIGDRLVIDK